MRISFLVVLALLSIGVAEGNIFTQVVGTPTASCSSNVEAVVGPCYSGSTPLYVAGLGTATTTVTFTYSTPDLTIQSMSTNYWLGGVLTDGQNHSWYVNVQEYLDNSGFIPITDPKAIYLDLDVSFIASGPQALGTVTVGSGGVCVVNIEAGIHHCRIPVTPGQSLPYTMSLVDLSQPSSGPADWDSMNDNLQITGLVITEAPAPETANFMSVAAGLLLVSLCSLARMHRSCSDGAVRPTPRG
jgi:hypothetical protein